MDDTPARGGASLTHVEAEAERQRLLGRKSDRADNPDLLQQRRQMTQEALADVDADRLIEDEDMETWADSLGSESELPPPQPR